MVEHEDESIHRLRASDPATGSHPDLHRLRALIAHKAPASQGMDRATAVDDDLLRGPRLRAPWIAAAAVAALAVGVGGYAVGVQQQDTAPGTLADGTQHEVGAAAPGPDTAGEEGEGSAYDSDLELTDEGAMVGEGSASMGGDSAMSGPAWDPGPVRLTAGEGLPDSPGTAEVRVLQSDQTPQEFIDAFAEATGFDGQPLPESDYFFGPGYQGAGLIDVEQGLVVTASDEGGALHFSYEDIYGNEYCAQMYEGLPEEDLAVMKQDWASSYGPDLPFPTPERCEEITGERPTQEQGTEQAAAFFAAAGLDASGYTFTALDSDPSSTLVMVDGQRSDSPGGGELILSAMVGPDGVVSAYGSIGEMTSLGEYPVISAAEAVERYSVREFSLDYNVSIAEDSAIWSEAEWESFEMPEITLPESTTLQPGDPIPMLLKDKVVTGAELVRGTLWTQTAGSVEVPAWKLTTDDGMYYPVLALAEEALDIQGWE